MKRIATVASAVIIMAGAGFSGLAAASASAIPAATPATSGTEHFQLITASPAETRYQIIIYGVVTAAGIDISGNHNTNTVRLPGGTFKLSHSLGTPTVSLNPATCLAIFSAPARYTIKNGTGAYAGISGHGTAQFNELAVLARNSKGKCDQTKNPAAVQQVITGSGPLST